MQSLNSIAFFLLPSSNLLAVMPYAHRTRLCLLHSQPLPSRDTYKFDNVEDAVALFNCKVDMHLQPSIVELTKILGTIINMKYYATAIHLYTQLESKDILPFSDTLNILISCYGHA
ncbi:hypothetical protein HN51_043673, partial [Arachis hypogaea]